MCESRSELARGDAEELQAPLDEFHYIEQLVKPEHIYDNESDSR